MPVRPTVPPAPPPAVEPMTGAELRHAGERLYGSRGWQKGLGQALDLDVSTIRRYVDQGRVPLVVAAAIRHLQRLQAAASPIAAGSAATVAGGPTGANTHADVRSPGSADASPAASGGSFRRRAPV